MRKALFVGLVLAALAGTSEAGVVKVGARLVRHPVGSVKAGVKGVAKGVAKVAKVAAKVAY